MQLLLVLNIATILVWIALVVLILNAMIRKARYDGLESAFREAFRGRTVVYFLLALLLTALARSLVFVKPQEVGVVVSLISANGYRERPIRSGLHWIPPLLEQVYTYPIAWQTYTMSRSPVEGQHSGNDAIIARSSDGQEVVMDCSIIYQVIPEQAVRIHIEWQQRYEEDFVRAVARGVVRGITSNYRVEEINSEKRQDLEIQINDSLREIFKEKGFAIDRFVLRNISFSPEFATSIERKQIALEGVEQSKHDAEQIRIRAKGEADAALMRAEAEAEALEIIAAALRSKPELLSYRYIEKLGPNIRVMLLPSDAPFILPLNESTMEGGLLAPTVTPEAGITPGPSPTAQPTP